MTKNNSDYSILYSLNSPYVLKVYYKNTPMREGELPPANLSTIVCSVGKFKILYETARAWKSLHNINKSLNNNNNIQDAIHLSVLSQTNTSYILFLSNSIISIVTIARGVELAACLPATCLPTLPTLVLPSYLPIHPLACLPVYQPTRPA